jgi:hypothetical protein
MNILGMTYDIAHDIRDGKLTKEDAIAEYGHLIDSETLDEILESLDCVTDNEDGTVTFHAPESWGLTPPE